MQRAFALATSMAVLGMTVPATAAQPVSSVRRVSPNHRITAVTVYPDRALITRTAHLDLVPGTYVVTMANLPARLLEDSVRSAGRGTAGVVMHGLDVRRAYVGESPQQRLTELTTEQTRLQDQDRGLQDRRQALDHQLKLLHQLADETAPSLVKQLGNNKAKLSEWQDTLGFIRTRLIETSTAMQQIDISRRQVAKRLREVNAKLSQLTSYRQTEVRVVPVNLEVTRAGGFDLDLTYAIPGARWLPSHEAQLQANGKQLTWRAFGQITNQTGEDWHDVALKLSTARPSAGGSAPTVPDWLLSPFVAYEPLARKTMMRAPAAPPPAPAPYAQGSGSMARDEDAPKEEAVSSQATMEEQGTSVTLALPSRIDVPSDGQSHLAPIGTFETAATDVYRCVPRYSDSVYLDVSLTNKAPWPLLRGDVRTYIGTTFVGTSHLAEVVSPDQKVALGMGLDEGLSVKRTRVQRQMQPAGLLANQTSWHYEYKLVLSNNKSTPQSVTVVEPYPRSENDQIRVTIGKATPKPQAESGRDLERKLTWQVTIPAHGQTEIDWGYQVEHPKDMTVTGLE